MTGKLKCPVCNVPLTECGDLLFCPNDHCAWTGNAELWNALIQAKQALEIARKALEEISSHYQDDIGKPTFVNWYFTAKKMCDCADEALKQIEHKDKA